MTHELVCACAEYAKMVVVLSFLLSATLCCGLAASSCPCSDPSLCEPIEKVPEKEVVGFVTSQTNWPGYNWTLLTTVAIFTTLNESLLCYAHSKGVRVVLSASYDTSKLDDPSSVKVSGLLTAVCIKI